MDFAFTGYGIKVLAFKNKSDVIFADYFKVCIKTVEILKFFEFFFILQNVFIVFDVNLCAAFAAGFAFAGAVIFFAQNICQKPFFKSYPHDYIIQFIILIFVNFLFNRGNNES